MEGIELGQSVELGQGVELGWDIELGDVEIGRIGNSLTNQDSQDSQGDFLVGSRVSDRMIQGAGTSPRRTRSGKVVKYREQ